MITEIDRLKKYLTTFSHSYPGIWRKLDRCRKELGVKAQGWSNWCFLPLDYATDVFREYVSDPPTPRECSDIPISVGLAGWRATQGVYQFDPTVYNALCSTPINGDMPVEVFYHLPEYCSYVLAPGLNFEGMDVRGFFLFLCENLDDSPKELCFAIDTKNANDDELLVFALDLSQTKLEAAVAVSARRNLAACDRLGFPTQALTPADISQMSLEIAPFLSLALYLCTKAAEGARRQRHARAAGKTEAEKNSKRHASLPAVAADGVGGGVQAGCGAQGGGEYGIRCVGRRGRRARQPAPPLQARALELLLGGQEERAANAERDCEVAAAHFRERRNAR